LSAKYYRDVIKPRANNVASPGKKLKQMRINESMLMNVDWSNNLKVACYELQNTSINDINII